MVKHNPSLELTLNKLSSDKTPVIDVRPAHEFVAGHLPLASSFPLSEIENLWHELPPKKTPLELVANHDQLKSLQEIFDRQDYPINTIQVMDAENSQTWQANNVSQRLWSANPLLENHIELLKQYVSHAYPLAFDIGAGSGRDSMFLHLHDFKALAIDNNSYALERLERFSERWSAPIESVNLDLQTQMGGLEQLIRLKQPQLLVQARYLHRPLLDMYKTSLGSGALVAVHTFTQEAAKFGKPKNPAYLLQDGELEQKFDDWKILLNQEHKLADGRPLSMFLAQKP